MASTASSFGVSPDSDSGFESSVGTARPKLPRLRSCLKHPSPGSSSLSSSVTTPASSRSSSPHPKCVAFCEPRACEVWVADEWDRTPAEVVPKLSYQDLLELKALTHMLPLAAQPPDPLARSARARRGEVRLGRVPLELLPLIEVEGVGEGQVLEMSELEEPQEKREQWLSSSTSPLPPPLPSMSRWTLPPPSGPWSSLPTAPSPSTLSPAPTPTPTPPATVTASLPKWPPPPPTPSGRYPPSPFYTHGPPPTPSHHKSALPPPPSTTSRPPPRTRSFAFLPLLDSSSSPAPDEEPRTFAEFEAMVERELALTSAAEREKEKEKEEVVLTETQKEQIVAVDGDKDFTYGEHHVEEGSEQEQEHDHDDRDHDHASTTDGRSTPGLTDASASASEDEHEHEYEPAQEPDAIYTHDDQYAPSHVSGAHPEMRVCSPLEKFALGRARARHCAPPGQAPASSAAFVRCTSPYA